MSGFPIRQGSNAAIPVMWLHPESGTPLGTVHESAISIIEIYRNGEVSPNSISNSQDFNSAIGDGIFMVSVPSTGTDTLGPLSLVVIGDTFRPVHKDCVVLPTNVYDSLYSTDKLDVNVVSLDNDTITSGTLSASAISEMQAGLSIPITGVLLAADQSHVTNLGAFDTSTNDISLTVDGTIDANIVQINGTGVNAYFSTNHEIVMGALADISGNVDDTYTVVTSITGDMIMAGHEYTVTTDNGSLGTIFVY